MGSELCFKKKIQGRTARLLKLKVPGISRSEMNGVVTWARMGVPLVSYISSLVKAKFVPVFDLSFCMGISPELVLSFERDSLSRIWCTKPSLKIDFRFAPRGSQQHFP